MSQTGSGQHGIVDSVVARTAVQRIRQQVMISTTNIGRSAPLGATVTCGGVNFSVFSRNASGIDLLLFDHEDDGRPSHVIRLDPTANRTYHYWHLFIPGLRVGQLYGFRVHGPFDPGKGLRFDPTKVFLDPYGRGATMTCFTEQRLPPCGSKKGVSNEHRSFPYFAGNSKHGSDEY